MIGAGELKYVLTELGEKMTEDEVDELMNATQTGGYVQCFPVCSSQTNILTRCVLKSLGTTTSTTKPL